MKIFSYKTFLSLIMLAMIFVGIIVSCKKESTECTAVIYAKYLNDTLQILPYADVIIAPQYPDVRVIGKTDIAGRFEHVFKYEGILDVVVYKPIAGTQDSVKGKGVIRLKPGETTTKTIFVK